MSNNLLTDYKEILQMRINGYTKRFLDFDLEFQYEAKEYFKFICEDILNLDEIKYEFTVEEAEFIKLSNIVINDDAIIN